MKKIILILFITLSVSYSAKALEYNVHTAPLLWYVGVVNASVDIPVSDSWTVGPAYASWGVSEFLIASFSISAIGINVNKHFWGNALENSLFVTMGAYIGSVSGSFLWLSESESTFIPSLGLGYQLIWKKFNMRLGAGIGPSMPLMDFSFGWVF